MRSSSGQISGRDSAIRTVGGSRRCRTAPRAVELGWPQIRASNEALHIDADTIAGPWDGTPVDYGRIVGHLAAVDGLA